MSEIKRGSMVRITDLGEVYGTYSTMFQHMKDKVGFGDDFKHVHGSSFLSKSKTYIVLSTAKHLDRPEREGTLALIHTDNQNGHIIGISGLELI
ncbi:hypothetical protein AAXB25_14470 [Paenibacillus lautus]|uniref:hypothetical protein n=1 Tax=Paenibacillus lautus TaxID=1401 RepID=UPI003D296A2C